MCLDLFLDVILIQKNNDAAGIITHSYGLCIKPHNPSRWFNMQNFRAKVKLNFFRFFKLPKGKNIIAITYGNLDPVVLLR